MSDTTPNTCEDFVRALVARYDESPASFEFDLSVPRIIDIDAGEATDWGPEIEALRALLPAEPTATRAVRSVARTGSIGDRIACNVQVENRWPMGGSLLFIGTLPAVGDSIEVDDAEGIPRTVLVKGRNWAPVPDGSMKATVWGEVVSDE